MNTLRELENNIVIKKPKKYKKPEEETTLLDILPSVIYAIIRKLNYMYDIERDEIRKEEILDKKARLIIQLILLEEKDV